jgi:hypothetical protein
VKNIYLVDSKDYESSLPNMCKALGSIPSTPILQKENNKEKEGREEERKKKGREEKREEGRGKDYETNKRYCDMKQIGDWQWWEAVTTLRSNESKVWGVGEGHCLAKAQLHLAPEMQKVYKIKMKCTDLSFPFSYPPFISQDLPLARNEDQG